MRKWTEEQRAAIADRRGSRLLAANAGSGKTAVMVERFAEAVLHDGVAVGAILALTFTEKAAGELRERVRRRFEELGHPEHAQAAEGAWVGTIHGFCARLLRTHPLAAGLDPRFTVLDEPAARRLASAAWERALESWTAAHGDAAVDLLAAYGPGLREAVSGVHAELRSRGARLPRLPEVPAAPAPDPGELAAARAAAASFLAGAPPGVRVDAARAALEAAERAPASGVPFPSALDPWRMGNGAKVLDEPPCQEYRAAWEAYREACAAHHARAALGLIDALLGEFGSAYEREKGRHAALDFEDLQLGVRDLLASDPDLRRRWSERFDLIMVDEFQDTNRLQLDVLEMLERDNGFAVGDEFQSIYGFRHADVGIFRARRDALGRERTRRLSANFRSREPLLDVINGAFAPLFGDAFAPLVAGGAEEEAPAAPLQLFDPDRAGSPADRGAPAVELLLTDADAWEAEGADAGLGLSLPGVAVWRRAEARLVARRLREERDGGRRAGDMVVLVRAAASLRLLEQALEEEGLPTYVVGGRGYWSHEQVRDGLAWLAALANPLDEEALHTVLASPFGGVGADALVLVAAAGREQGGAWAALRRAFAGTGGEEAWVADLAAGDRERLERVTRVLARERLVAERLSAEVLLERAAAATGYDLAVLARPGGERRLANLRKLMRLAREYERSEGRDLRGFLDHASGQEPAGAREGEAALESEGLDAVRLMTIHRAKGLEFPLVCVADLGRGTPATRPRLLVGADGRVGIRLAVLGGGKAVPALHYDDLAAERDAAEADEERRLLYVAMTRARDRLILSGGIDCAKLPERGTPLCWLLRALLDDPGAALAAASAREEGWVSEREWEGRPARLALRVGLPGRVAAPAPRAAPEGSRGTALPAPTSVRPLALRPGQERLPALRRLSYSSLGEYARCPYRFYLQRHLGLPDVSPPPAADGGAAPVEPALDPRVRGTIVHELLEELDFARPQAPDGQAVRAAAARQGVEPSPAAVADIAATVAAFGRSPLCGRLARASVRREAPFAFPLGEGPDAPLLHGFVDVIGREGNGGVLVVDYKTDRLEGADPEALAAAAYRTQRLVYALAALRDGAPRVEVAHCFLEAPERAASAVFGAADVPALAEELSGTAAGAVAGRHPVAANPHRALCGTCPGRAALCSHSEALTGREPAEALRAAA